MMDFVINPKSYGYYNNEIVGMYIQPKFKAISLIIKIALWYAVWSQRLEENCSIIAFGYKRRNFISEWLMKKFREDIVEEGHINDNLAIPMLVYYDWLGKDNYVVYRHQHVMDSFNAYRYSSSVYVDEPILSRTLFSVMKVIPNSYNINVPYLQLKLDTHEKMLAYNLLYFLHCGRHPLIHMGDRNAFETFLQH